MSIKENMIRDFISSINFKSDEWGLSMMKENMKKFLGEYPGIDIIYKKDVLINEDKTKAEEFINIDKIEIVFFDTDDKYKKLEFKI